MLFYRAPVDRPVTAVGVSLSPVRPGVGASAAGLGGRVRVVVRYGGPSGVVGVHRGWLHTDLPAGRRLRLLGCQADQGALLLSLGAVPARGGRERLTDRFRLPFHLTAWGVEAVAGVRTEVFCIPSVQPGFLLLRGRAAVTLEAPAARLGRVVSFCRRLAVDLNRHLGWRAFAAVEGLDLRVGPGGEVEGWLHVAVVCRGELAVSGWGASGTALTLGGAGGAGTGRGGHVATGGGVRVGTRRGMHVGTSGGMHVGTSGGMHVGVGGGSPADPAAVRQVDAAVARLTAEVVADGLALVSGAVELDVAWADRSGRGRWTCREAPFSALMEIAGLCEGDRVEPVAQVERLTRAGRGPDLRAVLLLGLGVTALRPVHREIGGAWYRMEQVVGQAVQTVELTVPLFSREAPPAPASPWRRMRLDTGLAGPWTALRARIRRVGGRAFLEVFAEPFGDGTPATAGEGRVESAKDEAGDTAPATAASGDMASATDEAGDTASATAPVGDTAPAKAQAGGQAQARARATHLAPATVRVEMPGGADAQIGLATVGSHAEVRARRLPDAGLEIRLPGTMAAGRWHLLEEPARWVLDAEPGADSLRCLLRGGDGLRSVRLPGPGTGPGMGEQGTVGAGSAPTAWTVAGLAARGAGMDRLWVEIGGG